MDKDVTLSYCIRCECLVTDDNHPKESHTVYLMVPESTLAKVTAQRDELLEAAKEALIEMYQMSEMFANRQYENEVIVSQTYQKFEQAITSVKSEKEEK